MTSVLVPIQLLVHSGKDVTSWSLKFTNFAKEKGYFSHLEFGFSAGSGCSEASFGIMEAINHIKEREGKVFACFLDVRKTFDTVWIDGLLYKLFSELGVKGKMFAMIKALYTDVESFVYFNGVSSQPFPIYQGPGRDAFWHLLCIKCTLTDLSRQFVTANAL